MVLYDLLLFFHITTAIIWVGSGFLLNFLAFRAERADDAAAMMKALHDMGSLGNVLFIPASFSTLLFGMLMIMVGPWSFEDLWVVIGLIGFATTAAFGLFVLKPRGEQIGAVIQRDGGVSAEAIARGRQLLVLGRLDAVLLFLVVADMALKPTIYDVGILIAFAVVLVGSTALLVARARAVGARVASA